MKRKIYIGEFQLPKITNIITENWADTKRKITRKTLFVLSELFPNASEEELSSMEQTVMRMFFHGRAASNPKLRPIEPLIAKILYGEANYQNKFMYDKFVLFKLRQVFRNIKTLASNNIKAEFDISDDLSSLEHKYGDKIEDLEKFGIDTSKKDIIKGNNEYECVEIEDFDMANEYGQYTCPDGELCYTQDEDTWNDENYSNNGTNTCYVFLRKGWENEKAVDGEDSPYDDYGLSMIWIFLNPEGNIVTSNSRWNHHNEENLPNGRETDYSFDEADISEITGYDVNELDSETNTTPEFLERSEIFKRFIEKGGDIQEAYYNKFVDDVERYGNGIFIATLGNSSTFIKDGNFLYPNLWVDTVRVGNLLKLFCDRAVNIMFPDGELLVDDNTWFKDVRYIPENKVFITYSENGGNIFDLNRMPLLGNNAQKIGIFYSNGKTNFDLLHVCSKNNTWYLYSLPNRDFINKEPSLKKIEPIEGSNLLRFADMNGFFDLIDYNGRRLYGEGKFKWMAFEFINGMLEVQVGTLGKKNFINKNGELMVPEDAELSYGATKFGDMGILCMINEKYYVVSENGTTLLTNVINSIIKNDFNAIAKWVNISYEASNGSSNIIGVKYSYDYIKNAVINNRVISDEWFGEVTPLNNNGFLCQTSYKYNILKPNGDLVFDTWANEIKTWKNSYLLAEFGSKNRWGQNSKVYAIINPNTFEIIHSGIEDVKPLGKDEAPTPVRFRDFSNYIKSDGTLLNSIKYTNVDYFNKYGWAETYIREENKKRYGYNVVFKDGSILSNELYEKILGGNNKIVIVKKDDENVYLISTYNRKETKYSYGMFPYLYKEGFGEIFGILDNKWDNKLKPFNMIKVWIKENPGDESYQNKNKTIGCNIVNLETNEFIFPNFYDYISSKDGKIFEVANWNERYYDIIDIDGNSLLGGRRPIGIESDYSPIGTYEVDFNDNGNEYKEFYDENFNFIQRMTNDEFNELERKKYGY